MLSGNSYSNKGSALGMSGAWMKHLFRRFAVTSLIALFGYFLFIHLPMIFNMKSPLEITGYAQGVVEGTNFGVMAIVSYLTVATSAMVFDYLHETSSVTLAHSFPLNRGKLFRSSVLAGYLMMLIPVVVAAVSMFVISRFSVDVPEKPDLRDIYSLSNSLCWLVDTVVMMTFNYAIATLAGIIAGNIVIHVILAFVLEGVPQITVILYNLYMTEFIFGIDESFDESLAVLSPTTHTIERQAVLSASDLGYVALYLGIALALFVIAGLLYKKIKLERERSTVVFKSAGDLLAAYFTFVSMSVFGMLLGALINTGTTNETFHRSSFIIPAAISGIVFFIIFRMIADGTVKVFTFKNLMKFLAFAAVVSIIFLVTVFDVLGLERKIPDQSSVDQVRVELDSPFHQSATLSDERDIAHVTELHREILKNKDSIQNMVGTWGEVEVKLHYSLKNGSPFTRTYRIPHPLPSDRIESGIDNIVKSDSFMQSVENRLEKWVRNNRRVYITTVVAEVEVPKKYRKGLVKAFIKDYRENKYSYRSELEEKYYNDGDSKLTFSKSGIGRINLEIDAPEYDYYESDSLIFGPEDKNVQKYLKESGLGKTIKDAE